MNNAKKTGHTPGPWSILNGDVVAPGAMRGELIDVASVYLTMDETSDFNGNLIAAAPELLERLKQCAEVLAAEGGHEGGLWLDEIRNTIAKAEGRQ